MSDFLDEEAYAEAMDEVARLEQQIEQLKKELAFQTDMANQADVACIGLKALLTCAADVLEWFEGTPQGLIAELRKAAD